jgi:hypothetical protein
MSTPTTSTQAAAGTVDAAAALVDDATTSAGGVDAPATVQPAGVADQPTYDQMVQYENTIR